MARIHERRTYSVYIMGSLTGTLYVGMTGNLHKRVFEHKSDRVEGFTEKYEVERLLYCESFDGVLKAIDREKTTKRLAPKQEDRTYRVGQSAMVRLE